MIGGTVECPNCARSVRLLDEFAQGNLAASYCSLSCFEQDQGVRKCDTCGDFQPEESFQPLKGTETHTIGCERCAATCQCGRVEGTMVRDHLVQDPELLDDEGRCRWCVASALVQHIRRAQELGMTSARAALQLCDLVEDLAPEVRS